MRFKTPHMTLMGAIYMWITSPACMPVLTLPVIARRGVVLALCVGLAIVIGVFTFMTYLTGTGSGLFLFLFLFADIVDFTPRTATNSPHDVVTVLNRIFSRFDELTLKRGLEKIKAIGPIETFWLTGARDG